MPSRVAVCMVTGARTSPRRRRAPRRPRGRRARLDGKEARRRVGHDDVTGLRPRDGGATGSPRRRRERTGCRTDGSRRPTPARDRRLVHAQADVLERDVSPSCDLVADDDASVRQVIRERAVERSRRGPPSDGPLRRNRDPMISKPTTAVTALRDLVDPVPLGSCRQVAVDAEHDLGLDEPGRRDVGGYLGAAREARRRSARTPAGSSACRACTSSTLRPAGRCAR